MALKQVLEVLDVVDSPTVGGADVLRLFTDSDLTETNTETVHGQKGSTDFVNIVIPGTNGKRDGGDAPTLGIIGRLGGLGARPKRIGFVSDGDGAAVAISAALKLHHMLLRGERLPGDVIITTHVCPDAPAIPHEPVEFMGSPVDIATMNEHEVLDEMDAILSIDTTKGNRILNHRGVAISAPVMQGYILKFSDDLIRLLETVTGESAKTLAITTQDITPYGNDVYHINSILQPAVAASVPVVGVAVTAASTVPGSATGASHEVDIATAARYVIEVAKEFGAKKCQFIDEAEYAHLVDLYGSLNHLSGFGQS